MEIKAFPKYTCNYSKDELWLRMYIKYNRYLELFRKYIALTNLCGMLKYGLNLHDFLQVCAG